MKNMSGLSCVVCVLAMGAVVHADECTGQDNGTLCTTDDVDCTDDVCMAQTCVHLTSFDGTPCTNDGLECTLDVCISGECTHDQRPVGAPCGDNSNTTCTNPDLCDEAGACLSNHAANGLPCDDGQFCADPDACYDGVCVGGSANCSPEEFCNEEFDVCSDCNTDAECDDLNSCTHEYCESTSKVCIILGTPGPPCGSGVDDECTDPDNCGPDGSCDPNNVPDGTACDGGVGRCIGGICAPPDFATSPMPEGGFAGSDLAGTFSTGTTAPRSAIAKRRKVTPAFGSAFTDDGVPHAVVWQEKDDGTFMLTQLDKTNFPSGINAGVRHDDGAGGGFDELGVGHVNNQPAAWAYDGLVWLFEDPGLPAGATGGSLLAGGMIISDTGNDRVLFAGFTYDSAGRIHADIWKRDEIGTWTNAMLPMLGPNTQSRATTVIVHQSMGVWVVGGGAETPQGHMRPAVWEEMTPGELDFDDPILLPLLPGMVSGVLDSGSGAYGDLYEDLVAIGTVTMAAGNRLGVIWMCGSGYTSCSTTVLPPLPGQANTMVTGLADYAEFVLAIVGTSYTTDRLSDGRATMWRVDLDTGDLLGTIDANNLMNAGPNARLVSLADDYGTCFGGNCQTAGVIVEDSGPAASAVGNPHVHAIRAMPRAAIPAVSEWGLLAMTLLLLVAGTVVSSRRPRRATA